MKAVSDFLSKALASCFFLTFPLAAWARKGGFRRSGAGFIGTVWGLFSIRFLPPDFFRCGLVLLGALFVSVAISDKAEQLLGHKDDQRIVIDEWVGYLVSAAFLPKTPFFLLAAFVLFRVVDVIKPLGIDRLGRLNGGWGVVMDDIAAGVLVNAVLHVLPRA